MKLNGREIKVLFVLSIAVPIGLLTSFRLTGLVKEPPTLMTVTAEAVSWQIDRPRDTIEFHGVLQDIENLYTNEGVTVSLGVLINNYRESSSSPPFDGNDGLTFRVYVNASVPQSTQESFAFKLFPTDNESAVYVHEQFGLSAQNAKVTHVRSWGTVTEEAFLMADGIGSSIYLSDQAYWILSDTNHIEHELEVVLEFTFQDQEVYRKIELPIVLSLREDAGETFETARAIPPGHYKATLDNVDYVDVYSLTLREGQTINVTMTPPTDANYDLYLCSSDREMLTNSTSVGDVVEAISHRVNATGTYYVKILCAHWAGHENKGIYELKLDA